MINLILAASFLLLAGISLRSIADHADAKDLALPVSCLVSWHIYNVGCLTGTGFPPPELLMMLESASAFSLAVLGTQMLIGTTYDFA